MNYDKLCIWFDAYDLLDNAEIGPLHADEMHDVRMRADAGDTYEEMHLTAADVDQDKLATAYEENLRVAVYDTAGRLGVDTLWVAQMQSNRTETWGGNPAKFTVEDAILAVAMQRVAVRWHVPEGRAAGGWAIFRDGMLTFEL